MGLEFGQIRVSYRFESSAPYETKLDLDGLKGVPCGTIMKLRVMPLLKSGHHNYGQVYMRDKSNPCYYLYFKILNSHQGGKLDPLYNWETKYFRKCKYSLCNICQLAM